MLATARTAPAELHFSSFLTQLKTEPSAEPSSRLDDPSASTPVPSADTFTTNYAPVRPLSSASSFHAPSGYYHSTTEVLPPRELPNSIPLWSTAVPSLSTETYGNHNPVLHPLLHHNTSLLRPNEDELVLDAQMLREVLQEMPSSHVSHRTPLMPGLQLLFASPLPSSDLHSANPPSFYPPPPSMASSSEMLLPMSQSAASANGHDLPSPSQNFAPPLATNVPLARKKRAPTTRVCKVEGCTKGIRSRGLCKAHGGGRRCTTPGCTTSDQGGGHCVLHGGGRRCRIDGCKKSAQWRGVCKMHGGARRCRYGQCSKNGQVKQGYCRMHHNLLTAQRQQQEQLQLQHSLQPLPPLPSMGGKRTMDGN